MPAKRLGRFCVLMATFLVWLPSAICLTGCYARGNAAPEMPKLGPRLVSITLTPSHSALNPGQTTHIEAIGTYSNGSTRDLTAGLTWTSSNAAVATIVDQPGHSGLAHALAPGKTTIHAWLGRVSGSASLTVGHFAGVLTYHNDLARTGQNLHETILTPANVNVTNFGKLFSDPVDGHVYAQPLYVPALSFPGSGLHNAVYLATENDSVYAFDADKAAPPLWRVSLLGPGETPVSPADVNCSDLVPNIGITSTPVIDPRTKTIYVVAMSKRVTSSKTLYFQRLHALDITTGKERPGSPVAISGTVPGTTVAFNPRLQFNRAGLALVKGVVYIGFGSFCDNGPYQGWLFAYRAATLAQIGAFNTAPTGSDAAIWQSGGAPSADSSGNIYVVTGNGTFDAFTGGSDYGDSFLKLSFDANTLGVSDYFAPYNQLELAGRDLDLGSAVPLLLPDSVGSPAHPHLMIAAGKEGTIYLVDRDHLGKFCSKCTASDTQIVQEVRDALASNFSNAAYWHGMVYFGSAGARISAFAIAHARLSTTPICVAPETYRYPGTTPAISANGSSNGILWALDVSEASIPGPAVLHAYLASDIGTELYSSNQAPGGRDTAGNAVKFTVPTIANGKVYVATQTELDVYGLLH